PVRSKLRLTPTRWLAESRRRDPIEPVQSHVPASGGTRAVRLLTLNVAHGRKLATHQALLSPETVRRNLEEIGALLRESRADIVALQEADRPSAWSGNFDHVELLPRLADHASCFRGVHNDSNLGRATLA